MKKMILIADSGSTKTDWCVISDGVIVCQVKTDGINPFFQSEIDIVKRLERSLLPQIESYVSAISAVYFYGAGCAFPEKNMIVEQAIAQYIPVNIEVRSDLWAAVRALCQRQPGIACILGTGANSCQYDGTKIINQVSPLGFILGDEGSGAVLGKLLVGDILKNQLSKDLREDFFKEYQLTPAMILDKVYKQPFPNRFLATFSPFIYKHIDEPSIKQIVVKSFTDFFVRNIMQYEYTKYPIHVVGSIAWYFQEQLKEVSRTLGLQIGTILQSPLEGLILYHAEHD